MEEADWKEQYNKVVLWIESKGYSVKDKKKVDDCVVFEDKDIYISSQYKYETKLYTLLHECGHYLLNETKETFLKSHPLYPSDVTDKRVERSIAYRVCIVSEELKAWERGCRLAERLNLTLNKDKFHKQMIEALWSYVLDITKDLRITIVHPAPHGSASVKHESK